MKKQIEQARGPAFPKEGMTLIFNGKVRRMSIRSSVTIYAPSFPTFTGHCYMSLSSARHTPILTRRQCPQVLKDEAATLNDIQIAGTGFMVVMVKVGACACLFQLPLRRRGSICMLFLTPFFMCCSRRSPRQPQRATCGSQCPCGALLAVCFSWPDSALVGQAGCTASTSSLWHIDHVG